MKDIKVIFMGTPTFAVPVLESLIDSTNVIMVVTQPDAYVGRKHILTACPIKEVALNNNIEVFTPTKIRNEYQKIIDLKPDLIVTCAYGQILPEEILNAPKIACINVHASLLPKLRGGAPIHHAIIDGYDKTGITIMYMDKLMDNGDIISQEETIIDINDTQKTLHDRLSIMGSKLLIKTLPSIINKTNNKVKQDIKEVTFGYNITKEDELINFNLTTKEVYNKIRGLNDVPGAYFKLDDNIIKVYESKMSNKKGTPSIISNIYKEGLGIYTKDGEIILTKIKPAGKKIMNAIDYLNGKDKNKLIGKKVNN